MGVATRLARTDFAGAEQSQADSLTLQLFIRLQFPRFQEFETRTRPERDLLVGPYRVLWRLGRINAASTSDLIAAWTRRPAVALCTQAGG
jgi:hypothetical protein